MMNVAGNDEEGSKTMDLLLLGNSDNIMWFLVFLLPPPPPQLHLLQSNNKKTKERSIGDRRWYSCEQFVIGCDK